MMFLIAYMTLVLKNVHIPGEIDTGLLIMAGLEMIVELATITMVLQKAGLM
jgi:hypothetical protein